MDKDTIRLAAEQLRDELTDNPICVQVYPFALDVLVRTPTLCEAFAKRLEKLSQKV